VLLVVAATGLELRFVSGADTLCCGIGPVEAAHATARRLAQEEPRALLHVGIAGALELEPPALVLGSEALYCDIVDPARDFPRVERARPDASLLERARLVLPDAAVLPIATSARVGSGARCAAVEAMEGFGVLRAAAAAGVPALELRAVSNTFDSPRADWKIEDALYALADALPRLIEALDA
jgi:futalosine hydrolase